jgi:hypothetical protein
MQDVPRGGSYILRNQLAYQKSLEENIVLQHAVPSQFYRCHCTEGTGHTGKAISLVSVGRGAFKFLGLCGRLPQCRCRIFDANHATANSCARVVTASILRT